MTAKPITISITQAAASGLLVALLGGGTVAGVQRATAATEPAQSEELRAELVELRRSIDGLRYDLGLICVQTGAPCQSARVSP